MTAMAIIECEKLCDVEVLVQKFAEAKMNVFVHEGIATYGRGFGKATERHKTYRLHIEFEAIDFVGNPFPEDYNEYRKQLQSAVTKFGSVFGKIILDTGLNLRGEYLISSPMLYGISFMD